MAGGTGIVTGMAGRYASALFQLARDEKSLDQASADLRKLSDLLAGSDDLRRLIRSPVFSAEEQGKAISAVLETVGVAPLTLKFVKLVAANRRLFAIEQMIKGFHALVAAEKGETTAEVTVAEELFASRRDELAKALEEITGKTVDFDVKVDPKILGGLIVRLGSRMVDASLKTKLNSIKLAMKEVG